MVHDASGVGVESLGAGSIAKVLDELCSASLEEGESCARSQVTGEGPAKAEGARVIVRRGGIEQLREVGEPGIGDPVDLLAPPTSGADQASRLECRSLSAQ